MVGVEHHQPPGEWGASQHAADALAVLCTRQGSPDIYIYICIYVCVYIYIWLG